MVRGKVARGDRGVRLIRYSLALVAACLVLLGAIAVGQVRNTAAALRGRELETMNECSRFAARELSYLVSQEEGNLLRALDLESAEALVASLGEVESRTDGITCFALLPDGLLLYPDLRGEGESIRSRLASLAVDRRGYLFDRLGRQSVARVDLPHEGDRLTASLFRLQTGMATGLVGICWTDAFVRRWCDSMVSDVLPSGYVLELSDAAGERIFRFPSAGEESGASGPEGQTVSWPLPADGFPWVVTVAAEDPLRVEKLVRRGAVIAGATLGLLALLIALGVWMLTAVMLREMDLGRLRSELAANISHELRTPLALIRGAADTLCERSNLDAAHAERYLGIIRAESRRVTEMINTVMQFTRLERGAVPPRVEIHEVVAQVREILVAQRRHLEQAGFAVKADMANAPLYARLDPEALRLVLVNLIDNAAKFSRDLKEITVRVEGRGSEVAVAVADRGIGIEQADQQRIFDAFFRVEGGRVKKTRGAGIGLALVRQIVKAHDGRITVDSAAGQGATFTVLLPRFAPPEDRDAEGRESDVEDPHRGR